MDKQAPGQDAVLAQPSSAIHPNVRSMKVLGAVLFLFVLLLLFPGCTVPLPGTNTTDSLVPVSPTLSPALPRITPNVSFVLPKNSSADMTVTFIDVAQGDAILIRSPEGKTMLIDAGREEYGAKIVSYLKSQNITTLDIVLLTHPHGDHYEGLPSVIRAFPVGQYIESACPSTASGYRELHTLINDRNIPVRTVTAGDTIPLDPALNMTVLNPPPVLYDEVNDNSIVIRIVYGNVSFLLMGDAQQDAEAGLVARNVTLSADILKVGHHGLKTSTTAPFVTKVVPRVAVISLAASDRSDHPDPNVVHWLEQAGSTVYRTDRDKTVTVISDGTSFTIVIGNTRAPGEWAVPSPAATA